MLETIKFIIKYLEGKKTYIFLTGMAVSSVLFSNGIIGEITRDVLFAIFGAGTVAAFKGGVTRTLKEGK